MKVAEDRTGVVIALNDENNWRDFDSKIVFKRMKMMILLYCPLIGYMNMKFMRFIFLPYLIFC